MKNLPELTGFKGNVRQSLVELIDTATTRTGKSGYSKGYTSKKVWTGETLAACKQLGIAVEWGNDASRKGANGEYIKLVSDRRKNKAIWEHIAILAEQKKRQQQEKERLAAIAEIEAKEAQQRTLQQFPELAEKFIAYHIRKGGTLPLSNKEANQVAWKKQNYISGGADVVTLRKLIVEYSRQISK